MNYFFKALKNKVTGLNTFKKLNNKNFSGKCDPIQNKMGTLEVINARTKIRSLRNRFKSRVEKLKRISKLESKSEENFSQYLAE